MMQGLTRHARRATRRAKRRRSGELNIVSMIDILTVLVFFLLVNSTGVSVLGLDMPDANATPPPPDHPPLALSVILRPGSLSVGGHGQILKMFPDTDSGPDYANLAHFLRELKETEPGEKSAMLLSDPSVPYNTIVQVMDVVRVQPTPDGLGERNLFPQISLGDAPVDKP